MKNYVGILVLLGLLTGCKIFSPDNRIEMPATSFEGFMEEYDVNEDGLVSLEEFDGRPRAFFALDRNRNGLITSNEVDRIVLGDKKMVR